MAYATEADLDRVWGVRDVDLVSIDATLAGRDHAKISAALDDASGIVESYCGRRYPLPLTLSDTGQRLVTGYVCDVAVYRLATQAGRMTEIIKDRNAQALAWLTAVAQGKADLLVVAAPGTAAAAPSITPNEAVLVADERFFSRDRLRGY